MAWMLNPVGPERLMSTSAVGDGKDDVRNQLSFGEHVSAARGGETWSAPSRPMLSYLR